MTHAQEIFYLVVTATSAILWFVFVFIVAYDNFSEEWEGLK